MAGSTAIVEAPAKLTLTLRVTGVRADGYHLIDAEMITLDLHDRLTIGEMDAVQLLVRRAGRLAPQEQRQTVLPAEPPRPARAE